MTSATDWRETLRSYLADVPEHQGWMRHAQTTDTPLCWEEVVAAYQYLGTEHMTKEQVEQFLREITTEVDNGA